MITSGVERVVCENCGLITDRYESFIEGDIDRSKFARDADKTDRRRHERVWSAWK